MIANLKETLSVYDVTQEIEKIYKGTLLVYGGWKNLITSGVPPLTLLKCKADNLLDYKIHGNSIQGENIVTYPYISPNDFSSNGITFTINSDKSITANGTATADTYFQIGRITLEANKTYILYQAPKGASPTTYSLLLNGVKRVVENDEYVTLTEEKTGVFYVLIHAGNTVNNLTFYPRIVEGPTPDAPIEVESVGNKSKNLFNAETSKFTMITTSDVKVTGTNSLTMSVKNPNGFYYAYVEIQNILKVGKTYTVSAMYDNSVYGGCNVDEFNEDGTRTQGGVTKFTLKEGYTYRLKFYANPSGTAITDGTTITVNYSNIQLEEGETATAYEPYGYRIPVKVRGKNLLDLSEIHGKSYASNGATMSVGEDGGISVSGTPTGYIGTNLVNKLNLKGITTFSILGDFTNISWQVTLRDSSNNILLDFTLGKTSPTKTIDMNNYPTYRDFVHYIKRSANNVQMRGTAYLQIEEGSGTKDYEPYKGEKTTSILLKEPLRKIGDYADYIDFENKKVVRNIKEYTLTGSEVVHAYGTITAGKYRLFVVVPDARGVDSNTIGVMSSHYLGQTASYLYMCNRGISCHGNPSFVIIYDDNYQTADSLKAFLKEQYNNGTPVRAIYLRQPIEETIELPNIPTIKGACILEVDTNVNSSYMDVVYKGKGKLELLNEEDNLILNSILNTDTETQLNITNTEISEILDEIIGG